MTSLEDRRLQDIFVLVYKCVKGLIATYLSSLFMERNLVFDLYRGKTKLVFPKPRTSTHGLNSFTYFATNHWNLLPDNARTASNTRSFYTILRRHYKLL